MKYFETTGNIWTFHTQGSWLVIPTNGFVKNNGDLVMGAGLARQANDRFQISHELGQAVASEGNRVQIYPAKKLISFPTKHHWTEQSDIALIETSLQQLAEIAELMCWKDREVAIPRVGCGNGKLEWPNVQPLFDKYLDGHFMLVNPKPKYAGGAIIAPNFSTGKFSKPILYPVYPMTAGSRPLTEEEEENLNKDLPF